MPQPRGGLGRGLDALIPAGAAAPASEVPIDAIRPNPRQPRRRIRPEDLEELAASLREVGIIQPLVVTAAPDAPGMYQLIAGERRWQAARLAGLARVPVVVREATPQDMLLLALVENIQRADRTRGRDAETTRLEDELRKALGTKVELYRSRKGGRVVIHFFCEEELQGLYDLLVRLSG